MYTVLGRLVTEYQTKRNVKDYSNNVPLPARLEPRIRHSGEREITRGEHFLC